MSIHTWKSFNVAYEKRAAAAWTKERWLRLTNMSKRELAELVTHLAALATDSYDEAIQNDELLFARIDEEREALAMQGML